MTGDFSLSMILIWPLRCKTEWETFKERKRNERKNQEVDESESDHNEAKESDFVKLQSNEHTEAEEEPKAEESPSKTKNESIKDSDENDSPSSYPRSQGRKAGISHLDDLFQETAV